MPKKKKDLEPKNSILTVPFIIDFYKQEQLETFTTNFLQNYKDLKMMSIGRDLKNGVYGNMFYCPPNIPTKEEAISLFFSNSVPDDIDGYFIWEGDTLDRHEINELYKSYKKNLIAPPKIQQNIDLKNPMIFEVSPITPEKMMEDIRNQFMMSNTYGDYSYVGRNEHNGKDIYLFHEEKFNHTKLDQKQIVQYFLEKDDDINILYNCILGNETGFKGKKLKSFIETVKLELSLDKNQKSKPFKIL